MLLVLIQGHSSQMSVVLLQGWPYVISVVTGVVIRH